MITLINEQRQTTLPEASAAAESLWLTSAQIERSLGWEWKPEGLCRGDTCVPLPRRTRLPLTAGDRLDAAAVWRHMGHPVVHDRSGSTWVFGTGADDRSRALESLEAPDFELPDLDGRPHRLTDHRGRKVLLVTWASW